MTDLRAAMAELSKRSLARSGGWLTQMQADLHPKQAAFIADPSRWKAALCTRRAGKTMGARYAMLQAAAAHEDAVVIYFALTRKSAKRIIWGSLLKALKQYHIPAKPLFSELTINMDSGGVIYVEGADQEDLADRFRGIATDLVVIDEAASFGPHAEDFINQVLAPGLSERRGTMLLTGTPGPVPHGIFYDATKDYEQTQGGYKVHCWSLLENPYIDGHRMRTEEKERNRWTDDNPSYQREWLGRWIEDPDALVYRCFSPRKSLYTELPAGDWRRILGVDLGHRDATALAVVAYSPTSPAVYIEHVEGHRNWDVTQTAERIKELREVWKPQHLIADCGALGAMIAEEFRRRFGLPIEAAEKTDKLTWVELMNGDFADGKAFVHSGLIELHHQYRTLTKKVMPSGKWQEDPALSNDLADATLYAYRKAYHYAYRPPPQEPAKGTPEAANKWADDHLRSLIRRGQQPPRARW